MRSRQILSMGLLAFATIQPATAFLPTELRSLGGAWGVSHITQTRESVEALWKEFFNIDREDRTQEMKDAREYIAKSNAAVDDDQEHAELHFDGESFIKGQDRLLTLADNCVGYLTQNPPDPKAARQSLGYALHSLQDFYSHTNWIELLLTLGSTLYPHPALGVPGAVIQPLASDVGTCNECAPWPGCDKSCKDNLATTDLTSGFYSGEPEFPKPGNWKCSHGGPFDGSSGGFFSSKRGQGINKDSTDCKLSPHYHFHDAAVGVSIDATKKYIRGIQDRITLQQAALLFAIKPEMIDPDLLDIIPDNTNNVKRDVLVARAASRSAGLHTFVNVRNVEESGRELTRAAAPGKVHGIQVVRRNMPRDNEDFGWKEVSLKSGGHVIKVAENETTEAVQFAAMISQPNIVEILNVAGEATDKIEYTFPIDSTLTSVLISAAGVSNFEVFSPEGSVIPMSDNDTSKVSNNMAFNMTSVPATGEYKIILHPVGEYSLSVGGVSSLSLTTFNFAMYAGRPGHEGYYPIIGSPLVGEATPIEAYVDGNFSEPQFEFRSKDNKLVAKQAFKQAPGQEEGSLLSIFEGNSTAIPEEDFMVYFTGLDVNSKSFQRAVLKLISPSKVTVSVPRTETLAMGVERKIRVAVTNNNNIPDTFEIFAADEKNVITSVTKTSMSLKAGAVGYFDVILKPEESVLPGTNQIVISVKGLKTKGNVAAMATVIEPKRIIQNNNAQSEVFFANNTKALIHSGRR